MNDSFVHEKVLVLPRFFAPSLAALPLIYEILLANALLPASFYIGAHWMMH